ncbi:LysR family transcriptional regulator [Methylobacillus caricis]|uniref:LysR family transcriptional regulator n=1 Tax=Methylobacillus caricis TaxID=1971611 RepID=UPI001CFFD59B|nr:LysR family transcriptional regulator [Methylobacillus caricis]MCB5187083.1 LysR family transcriptional regulator [Methylobacillus caricis]
MSIKLSIEALEVLDAIDRDGSFSAAAESLHRVPSAITYTIRTLEDDLDIKLFDRSGHKARLTEAGNELLREGRHLLKAAGELECRVRRVATGVETDISIAVSDILSMDPIYTMLEEFYAQQFGTRVRLLREVYGGSWDALISNRADISIGAPGDGPPGGGYTTRLLGTLDFVFAVAPHHPLAKVPEPLKNSDIQQYRSISAADSSRSLPPRTSGILDGQDVLSVPDIQSKALAQIKGLGVGYLPKKVAEQYAADGKLLIRQVAEPKTNVVGYIAWRSNGGKAQQWILKKLEKLSLEELLV